MRAANGERFATSVQQRPVNASDLADMGKCERRVVLAHRHGQRRSAREEAARRLGLAAHGRFEQQGRGGDADRAGAQGTVLHRDHGLWGGMADPGLTGLPGYGAAASTLGTLAGSELLPARSCDLWGSAGVSAAALAGAVGAAWRGAHVAVVAGMTAVALGLALVLVVLVVATLWRMASRRATLATERRQRPPALRDAELVFVEQTFRSQGRWSIVARVDRVYRLPSGELVLAPTEF